MLKLPFVTVDHGLFIINPIPQGYEGGVHLKGGGIPPARVFWALGAGYHIREAEIFIR